MKVLVVEDTPSVAILLKETLAEALGGPFEAEIIEDLATAMARARSGELDVVLLDLSLPDSSGLETVERMHAAAPNLPIVVTTSLDDEEIAIQAVSAGAQDYLVKGHASPLDLSRAIRYAVARARIEEELVQAREDADRANRAKSEFLSRMSHELRTPLNAILGFGQLLEMDLTEPQESENVRQILSAGRHLLDLINEVLDIARIEAGGMPLSLEPVGVHDAVLEAMHLVGPLGSDRQIVWDYASEDDPDQFVRADVQRLRQVLLNLLSNAVKYNRIGGEVRVSHERTPDGKVLISVSDTGKGIPQASLDRLFEPFERLGADAETEVEGTGLGLALARRLVEAMDGSIAVESRVGEGSTFSVLLEASELAAIVQPMDDDEVASVMAGPEMGPCTVLYIEDNVSNLRLVENIMELRPQVKLLSAPEGRVGLDLAHGRPPDLVLLDLNLPDIGGWEVLHELRADAATRDVPVVVISADASPTNVDDLIAAGAAAYLTKPINVKGLLKVLDGVLGLGD